MGIKAKTRPLDGRSGKLAKGRRYQGRSVLDPQARAKIEHQNAQALLKLNQPRRLTEGVR